MMTTVSLKEMLLDSAREVFETMVFMALEETPDGEAPAPTGSSGGAADLLATITFKGNMEGCLSICCSQGCAQSIAASMLGLDPGQGLGEDDAGDAMGEIANMVMGAVKSRIQEQVGTIEVSIPSVVQGHELKNSLGEGAQKVTVNASIEDEHGATFSLLYRESNG